MFNMWQNKLFLISLILAGVSAQQDANKLLSTFLRETAKIEEYKDQDFIVSPLTFIKSLVPLANLINHKYLPPDFLTNLATDTGVKESEILTFLAVSEMMHWNIWFHDKNTLTVINEQLSRMLLPSNAIQRIPLYGPSSSIGSRQDLTPVKNVLMAVKLKERNSKLAVLGASVFNAAWKYPFDPKSTEEYHRYVKKNQRQDVPRMSGTFNIFTGLFNKNGVAAHWIELPYKAKNPHDKLSMYIFKLYTPFEELESTLADINFNNLVGNEKKIELLMPKFTIKNQIINLQPILKKMGLGNIFENKTGLPIDKFLQTIVFSVSEFGTDASVNNPSYLPPEVDSGARPINFDTIPLSSASADTFWVDTPFVYAVVHKQSGLPLLFGHYVDFKWIK